MTPDPQLAELLRRLSHDLRSPLNVLQGAVDELAAPNPLDDPAGRERASSLARRALGRLGRYADRLALAGRLDQPLSAVREKVELRPLLKDAWLKLQQAEPRSKVGLTLNGDASWQSDRALLSSLLEELLSNGLKNARAAVTVQLEGPSVAVEDDGSGVEPLLVPTLFDTMRPRRAGLGLGLPMASALAAALGCDLSVERSKNGGFNRFALRAR